MVVVSEKLPLLAESSLCAERFSYNKNSHFLKHNYMKSNVFIRKCKYTKSYLNCGEVWEAVIAGREFLVLSKRVLTYLEHRVTINICLIVHWYCYKEHQRVTTLLPYQQWSVGMALAMVLETFWKSQWVPKSQFFPTSDTEGVNKLTLTVTRSSRQQRQPFQGRLPCFLRGCHYSLFPNLNPEFKTKAQ